MFTPKTGVYMRKSVDKINIFMGTRHGQMRQDERHWKEGNKLGVVQSYKTSIPDVGSWRVTRGVS